MPEAIEIQLGEALFHFEHFIDWVATAKRKYRNANITSVDSIAIDAKGRICTRGAHFRIAEEQDAYPIYVHPMRED